MLETVLVAHPVLPDAPLLWEILEDHEWSLKMLVNGKVASFD
jgi:hypothetical protein